MRVGLYIVGHNFSFVWWKLLAFIVYTHACSCDHSVQKKMALLKYTLWRLHQLFFQTAKFKYIIRTENEDMPDYCRARSRPILALQQSGTCSFSLSSLSTNHTLSFPSPSYPYYCFCEIINLSSDCKLKLLWTCSWYAHFVFQLLPPQFQRTRIKEQSPYFVIDEDTQCHICGKKLLKRFVTPVIIICCFACFFKAQEHLK